MTGNFAHGDPMTVTNCDGARVRGVVHAPRWWMLWSRIAWLVHLVQGRVMFVSTTDGYVLRLVLRGKL